MEGMDTDINTIVESCPGPVDTDALIAAMDQTVRHARERQLWSRFGTIGFEAYRDWVLEQNA